MDIDFSTMGTGYTLLGTVDTSTPGSSPKRRQPSRHLEFGRRGEELAIAFLLQTGYRIVASNFKIPVGRNRVGALVSTEIDLVAYEGPVLCFVEVKTRASDWFALPSANVDLRKQRQITRAARAYRRMFGLVSERYRYDVVSIVLPAEDESQATLKVDLLRNFWSDDKFRKRFHSENYYD
jgi:putative endonuclease